MLILMATGWRAKEHRHRWYHHRNYPERPASPSDSQSVPIFAAEAEHRRPPRPDCPGLGHDRQEQFIVQHTAHLQPLDRWPSRRASCENLWRLQNQWTGGDRQPQGRADLRSAGQVS